MPVVDSTPKENNSVFPAQLTPRSEIISLEDKMEGLALANSLKPLPPTPPRGQRRAWTRHRDAARPPGNHDFPCPLSPSSKGPCAPPRPRLIFESPRLEQEDHELFPLATDNLVHPQHRWNYMSDLAGAHQQDGSVLRIRPNLTPRSLALGMPSQAAQRVKELHLPPCLIARVIDQSDGPQQQHSVMEDEEDRRLPQWLDAVVQTFHNLQHIYLNVTTNEDESENSKRLRRLYVLYRLPDLVSIDGVQVSETERNLARPLSPNGQRVSHDNWLKQRLAEHDEKQQVGEGKQVQRNLEEQKPKRNTQQWLSEVLDEKKETDGTGEITHHPTNVEVDLAGKMTAVALSPPNRMTNPELMYETTSSVATADCAWAATCGQFFRPESMRKQWSKSRLRFSSTRRTDGSKLDPVVSEPDVCFVTPKVATVQESKLMENEHWTVVESGNTSPIMSKNPRPKGMLPPRIVLDASRGSPDRTSTLIIKSVPSGAPSLPPSPNSTPNSRCPPSRSLSSPFPMQFRESTASSSKRAVSPPKRTMPSPQHQSGSPLRISSTTGGVFPQRDLTVLDAETSKKGGGSDSLPPSRTITITGLSQPLPMKRTKSTPVRKGKRDLPPPCPGGGRRLLRIAPRVSKFKKQTARNTSIMDGADESEEDEEETTLVVIGTADTA